MENLPELSANKLRADDKFEKLLKELKAIVVKIGFSPLAYYEANQDSFDPSSATMDAVAYREALLNKYVRAPDVTSAAIGFFIKLAMYAGVMSTKKRVLMLVSKIKDPNERSSMRAITSQFVDYNSQKPDGTVSFSIHNLKAAFPEVGFTTRSMAIDPTDIVGPVFVINPTFNMVLAYPTVAQLHLNDKAQQLHKEWERYFWTVVIQGPRAIGFNEVWYDTKAKDQFLLWSISGVITPNAPYSISDLIKYSTTIYAMSHSADEVGAIPPGEMLGFIRGSQAHEMVKANGHLVISKSARIRARNKSIIEEDLNIGSEVVASIVTESEEEFLMSEYPGMKLAVAKEMHEYNKRTSGKAVTRKIAPTDTPMGTKTSTAPASSSDGGPTVQGGEMGK